MSNNIGLMYYKDYFADWKTTYTKKSPLDLKNKLVFFENLKLNTYRSFVNSIDLLTQNFNLITSYPGLLIGSGYAHEIGGETIANELKLGFFFDHTTGLPCIPGSSVKGVLRDACEKVGGKYIELILKELAEGKRKSTCKDVATKFVESSLESILFEKDKTSIFVNHVFEGKNIPIYKRDIFFDAFPIHSLNDGDKFLANDYITHHENPLKNPNPVQFLKVLPKVVFKFEFKLTDTKMPAALKEELFKQILLDLGIGAKTNVGYGQFRMPTKTENETIKNSTTDTVGIQNVIQTQNDSPIIIIAPTPPAILNRIQDNWITKFNKPIGEYYEGSFVSNFGGNKMFKFNGITISYKNTDLGDVNKETPILMKITETMILNHDLKFELKIKSENDIIVDNEPIIVLEKELVEDKNEDLLTIKIEKTVEIPISEEEQRITIAPSFEYTKNWAEVKTDCIVKTIVKTSGSGNNVFSLQFDDKKNETFKMQGKSLKVGEVVFLKITQMQGSMAKNNLTILKAIIFNG